METWNYRLVKEDGIIQLAEIHYHKDGMPYGWSEAFVLGDNLEEVQKVYKMIQPAFDNPILNAETDFVEGSNRMKKELEELYPDADFNDWNNEGNSCPVCGQCFRNISKHIGVIPQEETK